MRILCKKMAFYLYLIHRVVAETADWPDLMLVKVVGEWRKNHTLQTPFIQNRWSSVKRSVDVRAPGIIVLLHNFHEYHLHNTVVFRLSSSLLLFVSPASCTRNSNVHIFLQKVFLHSNINVPLCYISIVLVILWEIISNIIPHYQREISSICERSSLTKTVMDKDKCSLFQYL